MYSKYILSLLVDYKQVMMNSDTNLFGLIQAQSLKENLKNSNKEVLALHLKSKREYSILFFLPGLCQYTNKVLTHH